MARLIVLNGRPLIRAGAASGPLPATHHLVEGSPSMSVFSAAQLAYLGERRLARIATVGADGTPHVTPVGMWSHNPVHDSIDVTGREFARSKKYRDVARAGQAAIVIDDLASTDPWRPRGIEIRGRAETVTEPHELIRIHPDRVIAWGLDE